MTTKDQMRYKDPEHRKQYLKEWHHKSWLNKKAGISTKPKTKMTQEEALIRNRENNKKYQNQKKEYLIMVFGDRCKICGKVGVMMIHRKDGNKHKLFSNMSWVEIKKEVELHKDEYVRVCGICHNGVHWAMRYLGLIWDNIPYQK